MFNAVQHDGGVISAKDYNVEIHGSRLYCIDKNCRAPVIFVKGSDKRAAHFKTTGMQASVHTSSCGFYEPLNMIEAIEKVKEFQEDYLGNGLKETVVRLNLNQLDPFYEKRNIERKPKEKSEETEITIKEERSHPATLSSVKAIGRLLTMYEPDLLATILLDVGGSRKVPLSEMIVDQNKAHEYLWSDRALKNVGYFVYGKIEKLVRLDKVIYVEFEIKKECSFTLVVFEKYFAYFNYLDEDLEGKDVLVYGFLKKNEYMGKNTTEMIIKSNKYIEIINSL